MRVQRQRQTAENAENGIYENGARVKACIGFFGCNQARGKHLLALEAHEKEWAVGS